MRRPFFILAYLAATLACGGSQDDLWPAGHAPPVADAGYGGTTSRADAAASHDASTPPPVFTDSGSAADTGSNPATDSGFEFDSGGIRDSGAPNAACTFGAPHDGDGSFTWYYFGQGTGQENGYYVTACGYRGTESSNAGQSSADDVLDIASSGRASSRYFVAIPSASASDFDTVDECGACVELTHGATRIIATIVDACPKDSNVACHDPGHLDVSTQAFDALGYSEGNPPNTTWRRVACPITSNIRARLKDWNVDQVYLTNMVFPITLVTYQGQPARHLSYGAWQLPNGAHAAGATLTLTDVEGHFVTGVVPPNGGDMGVQLPTPSSCP